MQSPLINGRYQIIKTLGTGGFGDTFLVKDLQLPSQRQCVLKSLKAQASKPQIMQEIQRRFQREAAILETLGENHAQIPRLYAHFEEAGNFYLVQEWIDGLTLQELVTQKGCLSPDQVRRILLDLLPVLQSVHDQYIIHRDIKPDNIILRGADHKPVLIDFGAVKEALSTAIYLDGNGPVSMAIGTPGYMAPEQGAGRPVYSSDLYSLGYTAIYLLTGKSPQNFATDPRTGEICWQQNFPYLHLPLAQAIAKMVCFQPRDRFPTANALLQALLREQPTRIQETTVTRQPVSPPIQMQPQNATVATRVVAMPEQPSHRSVAPPPVVSPAALAMGNGQQPKQSKGCFPVGCAFLICSLVGIGGGLWFAISILGRSQVQTFPTDPESVDFPVDETPAEVTIPNNNLNLPERSPDTLPPELTPEPALEAPPATPSEPEPEMIPVKPNPSIPDYTTPAPTPPTVTPETPTLSEPQPIPEPPPEITPSEPEAPPETPPEVAPPVPVPQPDIPPATE